MVNTRPIVEILSSAVLLPSFIALDPFDTCPVVIKGSHTLWPARMLKVLLLINGFVIRHSKEVLKEDNWSNRACSRILSNVETRAREGRLGPRTHRKEEGNLNEG